MSMGVYNLVGLRWHGIFYTCVISHCHQHLVSKGSVGLCIPRIGRVIPIWDKLFFKLRVSFYGLVSRKKVFSESSRRIETHLNVVLEVLEVQSSVAFELCLDEEFIEFCELISCLRVHMPPFFVYCPPSYRGAFLLTGTTVVRSCAFGESILSGVDFESLIWFIIDAIIYMRSSVGFFVFSSESCLLALIVSCIMSNWSSAFLSILFRPLGILKLEVWMVGSPN